MTTREPEEGLVFLESVLPLMPNLRPAPDGASVAGTCLVGSRFVHEPSKDPQASRAGLRF